MDLVETPKKKRPYVRRQQGPVGPSVDQSALIAELIALVRDNSTQQNKVLESAMESQKAQSEMLKAWMQMFQPSTTPNKSTNEMDREAIRANAELGEWEPLAPLDLNDLTSGI